MNGEGNTPLYGLVLAGGKSTRMPQDKSILSYHGKPQTEYCFNLLSRFCDAVYVSNRKDQSGLPGHKDLPQIHDTCDNIGPLGGILSAMARHPDAAWLVLACDLPFVDANVLAELIKCRNLAKGGTAYKSSRDGLPEPLCAVYEPKVTASLLKSLTLGETCPRKILMNSDICLIDQKKDALQNVNDSKDYASAMNALGGQKSSHYERTQQ